MAVSDSFAPSRADGPFSRVGVSTNCSCIVYNARVAAEVEDRVHRLVRRCESSGRSRRHSIVPGEDDDVLRGEESRPESSIWRYRNRGKVEGAKSLANAAHARVGVAHVRVLGPHCGRDIPRPVREVPGVHRHLRPDSPWLKGDRDAA